MAKNRVKLNICGIQCTLLTDESEEYMESLGRAVSKTMESLMPNAAGLERAAITTALSFCDEAVKLRGGCDKEKESAFAEKLRLAQQELGKLREEKAALEKKLQRAEAKNTASQAQPQKAEKKIPQKEKADQLKNPLRPLDDCDQQGLVSFFEKK
ncbi:MAG: cell division protein ZapA [Oscillospiraceae bacterium]